MLYAFVSRFRTEIACVLALIIACIGSVAGFAASCREVRSEVLRLHVIANSDTQADQDLKLRVRDAVLTAGNDIFDGSTTVENAQDRLQAQMPQLEEAAQQVVAESGYHYPVRIQIRDTYFSTRTYDSFTMPAGNYTALQVIIGAGAGQNWWCVMFPPMCLPAAQEDAAYDAYFTDGEYAIVEREIEYEPRFKIVELWERYRNASNSK